MVSDRFDRVQDYTKQIAIVPCSAQTGEGIPELMMVMTGLAQRFLEQCLQCDVSGDAKGTVLEVKEEKGLGTTLDVIIFDGHLKVNDTIVIGSVSAPIVTKIRALLEPASLADMRDKKTKFRSIKEIAAATGVKISAPNIGGVIAGMPIMSAMKSDIESVKQSIQEEVEDVIIETEKEGIIIKADSLGSLEALINLLQAKGIAIRKATIGDLTKKDVADAETNYDKNPLNSVILVFNLPVPDEISSMSGKVKIISSQIIYKIIEDFEAWQAEEKKRQESKELDEVVRPCKLHILNGYVFRQSNPAVVGVEVVAGTAKTGMPMMNIDGKEITLIKSLQEDQESMQKAEKGKQVAVSMDGVTVGRQIKEGDILYSAIPEQDFIKMKKLKQYLSPDEVEVIKEIANIKRRNNTVWGVG